MKYGKVITMLNLYMMTSSNGKCFRVTGPLCGKFIGHRWIPLKKLSERNFDVFFDLRLKKRLSKQSRRWWFETQSHSLWCHCNVWRTWHLPLGSIKLMYERPRSLLGPHAKWFVKCDKILCIFCSYFFNANNYYSNLVFVWPIWLSVRVKHDRYEIHS